MPSELLHCLSEAVISSGAFSTSGGAQTELAEADAAELFTTRPAADLAAAPAADSGRP
jgi:hypothetical protein